MAEPRAVLSTKTINWGLIRQQYDQIVKHTTDPQRIAEAEQVLHAGALWVSGWSGRALPALRPRAEAEPPVAVAVAVAVRAYLDREPTAE
ncbi:hypothetical protein [Streptomyces sp. NPDC000351]|uniref:hypothetical protein n=1 Tax=Streptomyces sp. NPDC000351 TaxID=3154250 RepID=UPI00332E3E88